MKIFISIFLLLFFPVLGLGSTDSHVHLFSPENFGSDSVSVNQILPLLDNAGMDRVVVISFAYKFSEEEKAKVENDFISREVLANTGRIKGFCGIHPMQNWAENELLRCIKTLKLHGLKLHPNASKFSFADKRTVSKLEAIFNITDQYQLPVLIDSIGWSDEEMKAFGFVAMKHRNTKFILAHAFYFDFRRLLVFGEFRNEMPNVYADISHTIISYMGSPEQETLTWYLRKFGVDRLLFGSDFPVHSPEETSKALKNYSFSQNEQKQIFEGTASTIFGTP